MDKRIGQARPPKGGEEAEKGRTVHRSLAWSCLLGQSVSEQTARLSPSGLTNTIMLVQG